VPDIVAIDTETFCFGPGNTAPPIVVTSWSYDDRNYGLIDRWQGHDFWEILLRADTHIVGHNIAYDLACVCSTYPDLTTLIWQAYRDGRVRDTMIREKLSDICRGQYRGFTTDSGQYVPLKYDLGSVARRRAKFEVNKDDPWRVRYGELYDTQLDQWPDDAKKYAQDDAIATRLSFEAQALLADPTTAPTRVRPYSQYLYVDELPQVRAAWWLRLCANRGITTSLEAVKELELAARGEMDFLAEALEEAGLLVNGVAKKAAAEARVREAYESTARPVRLTEKGGVCCDCDACLESGDILLESLVDYKSARKTITTEVKAYSAGLIHTHFESLAETGRTTSSQPNIQNVRWQFHDLCTQCGSGRTDHGTCLICGGVAKAPPGVRECFVPRPGFVFGSADYDGLELRTLAQVCLRLLGHSELARALNEGRDPHMMVAAELLGRPYDWCVEHKKEKGVKFARQCGKVANFGFPGGLGIKKFILFARMSYKVRLTEQQAKRLKAIWLSTFPEFSEYFRYIESLKQPDGTYAVDHLFSGRVRTGCHFTVACNSFFQGLGADATKAAGFLIAQECYDPSLNSPLYGCHMVNYIHDEFILEVPDDGPDYSRANAAVKRLVELMVEGAAPYLPDVPATATPQLMVRWSKNAEPVYVDGHLVPWGLDS